MRGRAGALFGGGGRSGRLEASQPPAAAALLGLGAPAAGSSLGASRSGKQSGPQIQNDSLNKYDFSFYVGI